MANENSAVDRVRLRCRDGERISLDDLKCMFAGHAACDCITVVFADGSKLFPFGLLRYLFLSVADRAVERTSVIFPKLKRRMFDAMVHLWCQGYVDIPLSAEDYFRRWSSHLGLRCLQSGYKVRDCFSCLFWLLF